MTQSTLSDEKLMKQTMSDPKNKGFHVLVWHGEVYTAKTGGKLSRILQELREKDPHAVPITTYIPSQDTLVL